MKFWNAQLRICPRCQAETELSDQPRTECEQCGATVWFYNYREIPPPPPVPSPKSLRLQDDPISLGLIGGALLFAFVALFAVIANVSYGTAVVAASCAIATLGFVGFAFYRHREAREVEGQLAHAHTVWKYGKVMHERGQELVARYDYLLRTGNKRIEHYFDEIFGKAAAEREQAEQIRRIAANDRRAVASVEQRIYAMAERFLGDHIKWSSQKLRADVENFQRRRNELDKAFDFVLTTGYRPPRKLKAESLAKLKENYAKVVREQQAKDEQRRLKQQVLEEEQLRREAEAARIEAAEREREVQVRLEEAMLVHQNEHSAEVEELRRQLEEAQLASLRATSMAQLTKAGHVYILSNVGSFGPNVYKVGMTRRLDPQLRVRELGDASVPFPFDVHAMFSCEDAPALENKLHRALTQYRVNRINLRKEYFNVDLQHILDLVEQHHGTIEYLAEPEALEYYESQAISPEDLMETVEELVEVGAYIEDEEE